MRKTTRILAYGFTISWLAAAVIWLASGFLADRDPATGKAYAEK